MELTQTSAALFPLVLWAAAQGALLYLTWACAAKLDDRECAAARLHLAIALALFCILAGTAAAVFTGSRLVIALAPFAVAALLRRRCGTSAPAAPVSPFERAFFAALAVFTAGAALLGAATPLYQYDGLLYHLPTAALAWQQRTVFVSAAHPQIGGNPVLPELAKTWAFALSGGDTLAGIQQLPALVALAALAYALSRRWGAARAASFAAGACVLLAPKAFAQALSPQVDLLAGLAGATAAVLLARRARTGAKALVLYSQLKFTTVLPALGGAAVVFFRIARGRPALAALWVLVFAAAGGFWEWRNLAVYGNPTRPYQILVGSGGLARLAPGWLVETARADKWSGYYLNNLEQVAGASHAPAPARFFAAWGDSLYVPYDAFAGRWGPAWFAVAVPALALLLLLRRRRAPRELLLALLFYFLTVKAWEGRFGLVLLPFGFAAGAVALSRAKRALGIRWLPAAVAVPLLAWCAVQIALSHPYPALRRRPGLGALELATRSPDAAGVGSLAAAVDRLSPRSLWIDFTVGERHYYGMASSLLYPYFSRRWDRAITIRANSSAGEVTAAAPDALLLQPGSALGAEALGYRKVFENAQGALYAKR